MKHPFFGMVEGLESYFSDMDIECRQVASHIQEDSITTVEVYQITTESDLIGEYKVEKSLVNDDMVFKDITYRGTIPGITNSHITLSAIAQKNPWNDLIPVHNNTPENPLHRIDNHPYINFATHEKKETRAHTIPFAKPLTQFIKASGAYVNTSMPTLQKTDAGTMREYTVFDKDTKLGTIEVEFKRALFNPDKQKITRVSYEGIVPGYSHKYIELIAKAQSLPITQGRMLIDRTNPIFYESMTQRFPMIRLDSHPVRFVAFEK